jgi:hypothetical protein
MSSSVNYTIEAITNVWIRNAPSLSGDRLGLLSKGTVIHATEQEGNWVKHDRGGWSSLYDAAGKKLILKITSTGNTTTTNTTNTNTDPAQQQSSYSSYVDVTVNDINASTDLFIKSARGIHAMPYQFMPSVDRRLPNSVFGRKFSEKILTKMPLLLLTPGKPKFMNGFTIKEKSDLIRYMTEKDETKDKSFMDKLTDDNREKRYYSFDFNYNAYYDYVNPMLNVGARFLNLQNKTIDGKKLDVYNWQDYANPSFKSFISSKESVAFYIDSETQISESFSNNTGESLIANKANSLSDLGREMQFLLGSTAGVEIQQLAASNASSTLQQFKDFTDKHFKTGMGNLINNLGSGIISVASGGKLIFPEIWNDSNFSRSYSVNVKLRTPDGDPYSWFMNIYVPMIHLICLVAPQQMGPNGYSAPFLIRGYYKGLFNVDTGIITSMNISKGNSSKWTIDGLPTEVDINFDIKDLYQVMTITKLGSLGSFSMIDNIALMDYIANLCGININKPDVLRMLDIYKQTIINQITDNNPIMGTYKKLEEKLTNTIFHLFRK